MVESTEDGRLVIAGGTGFIGRHLARRARERGYDVVLLGRHRPPDGGGPDARFAAWDGRSLAGGWADVLAGATALVNLAGRSVDCVKTPDHRDEILRSRVESTAVLGEALRGVDDPSPVWVQMSTAHIYGDPPSAWCTEESATGYGLAPTVGRAWESAFVAARLPGQRAVTLRTSFVIGRAGGALPTLRRLARLGLGGRVGHGRQGLSWLHEDDMAGLILDAVRDDSFAGTYVASAPAPVSQAEFMRTLRGVLGVPLGLPSPAWLTRLGAALVFRTDPELLLYGRYVRSERLAARGYPWRFPELREALEDLCRGRDRG